MSLRAVSGRYIAKSDTRSITEASQTGGDRRIRRRTYPRGAEGWIGHVGCRYVTARQIAGIMTSAASGCGRSRKVMRSWSSMHGAWYRVPRVTA